METMPDLNQLMEEQLLDMFDGKLQLAKAMPTMQSNATGNRLKVLLDEYREKNEEEMLHLKQAFTLLFRKKRGQKCEAMEVMLKEANHLSKKSYHPKIVDAGLITALQHIIQYQITGYEAIGNYANTLGFYDVARLIHLDLEKEKNASHRLGRLAGKKVNTETVMTT